MARYDITLQLPAAPGAWLNDPPADRLGTALVSLPAGPVRTARLVSRTHRGYQVVRVKVQMSVTAPDMTAALGAAVEALAAAAAADAGEWDAAGLAAEVRPAPVRPAPRPGSGRATSARPGRPGQSLRP